MDVKRSTKVALAKRDVGMDWLAKQVGISRQAAYQLINRETHKASTLTKLAGVFDMSVSEFIALGEDQA